MEDDAIPMSGPENERTTPDDFVINSDTEAVVAASGRNISLASSIQDSPSITTGPVPAVSSLSSVIMEHPIVSLNTSRSIPISPETHQLTREQPALPSMEESAVGGTEFGEALSRVPSRPEPAQRRRLPSRSPPTHRSPPYHRSEPTDQYQSAPGLRSSLIHPVSPHPPQVVAVTSGASSHYAFCHEQPAESRPNNEYYESLRREYDLLSQELREMTENICCRVCMDREARVVFMPCAHLSTCARCASQLSICPICRSPVHYTHTAIIA